MLHFRGQPRTPVPTGRSLCRKHIRNRLQIPLAPPRFFAALENDRRGFAQNDTRRILNLLLRNMTIKNRLLGIDKFPALVYNNHVRRHSLVVKPQLPKLMLRVRFPLPAPKRGRRVRKHPSSSFCTSHRIRTPHMAHSRHRAGLRRMRNRLMMHIGANELHARSAAVSS